jgi:hypothetical protein
LLQSSSPFRGGGGGVNKYHFLINIRDKKGNIINPNFSLVHSVPIEINLDNPDSENFGFKKKEVPLIEAPLI